MPIRGGHLLDARLPCFESGPESNQATKHIEAQDVRQGAQTAKETL